ncbi:MAG: ATP-binding protein [Desulfobacteraceae bacterium]|nr:ATP-binding protein [Desulfobacteraceae bacterium]
MPKTNPFKPNCPVPPGMFVGRINAVESLEQCLIQTKSGQPVNFTIIGERGIGKSSLLLYLTFLARGEVKYVIDDTVFSFLVISTDIEPSTSQLGLIRKIKLGLERQLSKTEAGMDFLKKAWAFLQRLEIGGSRINPKPEDLEVVQEEFAYSLADTVTRITEGQANQNLFSNSYDGVVLLIDEASNASEELNLGLFLKLLCERLQRNSCNKVVIGLAGLPDLRNILQKSHASSLRLFDEIRLDRLETSEVKEIIHSCLEVSKKESGIETTIDPDAESLITVFSEGYPHFTQQIGYSAFATDTDNHITKVDVHKGFWGEHGALELIGSRYYRDDFYGKIQKDSYRQVLRIMAEHLDDWVTKRQIREKYKGKNTTLDNAVSALKTRNIIMAKEGERGIYRLQHKGFAAWIKRYTDDRQNVPGD